jgi:PIN domain nuclease of toxin-antitoxin system
MSESVIFLDTCALLYLASNPEKLSSHALKMVDNAQVVMVSSISAWEISLKHLRGDLELPIEPEEWFDTAVEKYSLEIYPLTPAVLMKANRLPWHHKDPADRFIITSAKEAKAVLLTTDTKMQSYDVPVIQ